mgnify:CR=1 FL=1
MSPDREPRQHTSPVVASPPVPAGNIGDESAQSSPLLQDKLAQPVACIRGRAMNPAIGHEGEHLGAPLAFGGDSASFSQKYPLGGPSR